MERVTLLVGFFVAPGAYANDDACLRDLRALVADADLQKQVREGAVKNLQERSDDFKDIDLRHFLETPFGTATAHAVAETLNETGSAEAATSCAVTRTGMDYKDFVLNMQTMAKNLGAKNYRKVLDIFREVMTHAGEINRKYISGQEMDANAFRWHALENLFKKGKFQGSFGHGVYKGATEPMGKIVFDEHVLDAYGKQTRPLGESLKLGGKAGSVPMKPIQVGPMMGISGMSFPQLSAQSHLSLMYIHLKLAKELGLRQLLNTGEGGPLFHLALLEGNREGMKLQARQWALKTGQFHSGSWDEAKVNHFVDELMDQRNKLFAEFSQKDLEQAQVVAQFGPALNGVRSEKGNLVDFNKLKRVAASPYVAMVQFKLKQAAKRGAKVDPSKIDHIVASLREIDRSKPFPVPEVIPETSSYEELAKLIIATKVVAKKPVSLKFGVGDVRDFHDFMDFLKRADALPDHIQLDGRGPDFSPGSGNAPPMNNSSLPINEAIISVDAVLKKLGIRDKVFVDATGDVLLPNEGIEKLALGADAVSGARVWLGMGLGCSQVRACANGACPYGIAARSNSMFAAGLNPLEIGPKGYEAAASWWKGYAHALAETGAKDWRSLRKDIGLGSKGPSVIRKKDGEKMVQLKTFFNEAYVNDLLEGVLTPEEVKKFVFGGR